jgi:signal transduction histidine kinase
MKNLHQLGTALLHEHDAILQRWRTQVRALDSAKHLDTPTLNDHIPGWLRAFAGKLLAFGQVEAPSAATGPVAHGVQRFDDGFDIEEVVAEYNILRDCVYEFAEGQGLELRGESRRVVDRVFDESTGLAVKSFAESQAHEVQRRRVEHLAFVAHDLRTPLSAPSRIAAAILERRLPPETRDADTARVLKTLARNAQAARCARRAGAPGKHAAPHRARRQGRAPLVRPLARRRDAAPGPAASRRARPAPAW